MAMIKQSGVRVGKWFDLSRANIEDVRAALPKINRVGAGDDGPESLDPLSEKFGDITKGTRVRFTKDARGDAVVMFEYPDAAAMVVSSEIFWGQSCMNEDNRWIFECEVGHFTEDGNPVDAE